jgi:Flp pilus assembly protein TadD
LFTLGERDASPPAAPPGARPALAGSVHDRIRALLAQGDAAGAAALAREALSESADDGELFYLYAQALWDGGDRTGAIARLRDAARLVPARRLDLAKALEASGDLPEAIQQYQQLVQDRPDDRDAQHRLGSALLSAKRYADAVAPLRAAAGPEDPVALQDLGWALEKSGDSNGALETYRSILEGVPGAHLTRSRMSEVLFNAGRGQEALELVRGGLALEDSAPLLHRTLGSLLERSGQPEAAAQEYRTFLKLSPNSSEAADIRSRAERLESRSASR